MSEDTVTLINTQDLTVSINKKNLIEHISFAVKKGTVTGLVGENGAGKSTLMKAILDFNTVSSGSIQLGAYPHHHKHARRILAYLPEHFSPPQFLNGQEYLDYCAKLYGIAYPSRQTLSDQLGLPEAAFTRPVKALSKGMTQKLGLLAVLNSQRPLLLLDEPMSGLDPRARYLLRCALSALKESKNTTILFTTHMLNDIQELADTMLLMHQGSLRYAGSPAELLQQTKSQSLEEAFLKKIAFK
jgi:ABC-2 type transport system ATP-binding protein